MDAETRKILNENTKLDAAMDDLVKRLARAIAETPRGSIEFFFTWKDPGEVRLPKAIVCEYYD